MTTSSEVFLHELKDLHSAESQLIKALPKMAKQEEGYGRKSEELRQN